KYARRIVQQKMEFGMVVASRAIQMREETLEAFAARQTSSWGFDINAPLRQSEQKLDRKFAIDRRVPHCIRNLLIEPVNPLGNAPCCERNHHTAKGLNCVEGTGG